MFKLSKNSVADEKVDSTLLILLFALISKKLELILIPDSVLKRSSWISILLIVEVESNCSLGKIVSNNLPPFSKIKYSSSSWK